MKLQTLFEHGFDKLHGGPANLRVQEGDRELTCDFVEQNSLAASFRALQLATSELASAKVSDVERIAKALAARLTYLMEPISPIETDADACVVQLRSHPPQKDDDGRSYYELSVRRGGELALARYRKVNGEPRQPVPAMVTREVLLRLVGDFSAVLD
jgi:hypothetical protein